ncbi:hypothetical protein TPHA_0G01200 [Tetrapisispora phaffii CBS 4417]|uniref:Carbamoyl phosphate synthase arginine-specific small chain n=1 Tax=Tetrapisispora phaffii (strain ATCC 24235 / CBS 4417 / NBRC 1672 / NRRL Y-8282 / UCD 70-5) TaxID=1071381 RepID=G8BVM9_TETPH|nr:hypothetical protein TPHA_0G01200 [Tetrapisispora phaffii CBS 4417]CCE63957.1 hypothetical protein TPHA_0G01200 [Tetrapisispora phaffii CBS 4417]
MLQLDETTAVLEIKNGPSFEGVSFGADKNVSGEVVFTTSLVGYTESMTDPSYCGQILVFTQPLVGNYGVPSGDERDEFNLLKYFESPNVNVCGIIVSNYSYKYSHWTAVQSLADWCKKNDIPAITDVDTREIVQYLREQGSSLGRITIDGTGKELDFTDPMEENLVEKISTKVPYYVKCNVPNSNVNIALIDCGVKENIVRCLVSRGANVTVFPYDYKIQDVADQFDGIFISNGPGNPEVCTKTIENLKILLNHKELQDLPIFGICLGHQLLALASGAATTKLKYGNRAHNIPVMDLTSGKCYITSQNHGYAVDADTLPKNEWKPFCVNLNDNSNEGMIHLSKPIFSTQFHPESKGGPLDTVTLFDKYFENIKTYKLLKAHNLKLDKPFLLDVSDFPNDRVLIV